MPEMNPGVNGDAFSRLQLRLPVTPYSRSVVAPAARMRRLKTVSVQIKAPDRNYRRADNGDDGAPTPSATAPTADDSVGGAETSNARAHHWA